MNGTTSSRRSSNGYWDLTALLCKKGYYINERIGNKGRFGKVYLSTKTSNKDEGKLFKLGSIQNFQVFARKSTRKDERVVIKFLNDGHDTRVLREINALKKVNHPNVVRVIEIFSEGGRHFVVSEYGHHGDLLQLIHLKLHLDELLSLSLFHGICSGVEYLHSLNLIHRDLKCENIILDKNNQAIITDFAIVKEMTPSEKSDTFCGSIAYTAPEVLEGNPYHGTPVDIWSVGVILYVMAFGVLPFRHLCITTLVHDQRNLKFFADDQTSESLKDLLSRILCCDLELRYTMQQIKSHDWFSQAGNDDMTEKKPSLWGKLRLAVLKNKRVTDI